MHSCEGNYVDESAALLMVQHHRALLSLSRFPSVAVIILCREDRNERKDEREKETQRKRQNERERGGRGGGLFGRRKESGMNFYELRKLICVFR